MTIQKGLQFNKILLWAVPALIMAGAVSGFGLFYNSEDFNGAEVVSVAVSAAPLQSGFITPASCGVCVNFDPESGTCWGYLDYGHPEWGGACSPPPAPSVDIKANGSDGPILIASGESATISWSSTNTSGCSISPAGWSGTSGSQSTGALTSSQTYTANCSGPGGVISDSATVNVVSADIKANGSDGPITIAYGESATISWSSTNATVCSVSPPGWAGISGSQSTGALTSTQTYDLECTTSGSGNVITVTSATYAANCGAPTSVNSVASTCNGLQSCLYTMNYTVDPGYDPAYGCAKDLSINYTCPVEGARSAYIAPEAHAQSVTLNCPSGGGAPLSASDSVIVNVSEEALLASCSANPTSITAGDSATWTASVSGGTGSYSYSWSGSEGLSGTSNPITKQYDLPGTKNASVTVTSGSQTVNPSCPNPVSVSPQTLSVSLSANPSSGSAPLNGVDLTATVSGSAGGTINYTFYCDRSDSGTNITSPWDAKFDGITENPKTAVDVCDYSSAGTYSAKVIVERGALATESRQTVTVDYPALSASCSAAPGAAITGQTVTWSASASGGTGSYSYSWSGNAPLSGQSGNPVNIEYSSPDTKTGSVTVTSGAQQITQACLNSVTVAAAECSDGLDNDGDGNTDYPADASCSGPNDDDERNPVQCQDGTDNDGDGLNDYPEDPGCSAAEDDNELNACTDGIDNDGDGKSDYPEDPGCTSAQDNNEVDPTRPIFEEVLPE